MLSIEPKDLKSALAAVKPAVGKSSIETLASVHITSDAGGHVHMVSTNMSESIRRRLVGANVAPGVRLDLLLKFADLEKVANLNANRDRLHLLPTEDGADAKSGNRTIHLKTGGVREDWPTINFERGPVLLEANGPALANAFKRSSLWASKDETRPHLTGVQFDLSTDEPLLAATDSYRLGLEPVPVLDHVQRPAAACPVVPRTALLTAAKLMAKAEYVYMFAGTRTTTRRASEAEKKIGVADTVDAPTEVLIEIDPGSPGETTIVSRTIDGRFPNWRQLIPDAFEYEVKMPTDGFREACAAAKTLTTANQPMRVAVNGDVRVKVQGIDTAPSLDELVGGSSIDRLTAESADLEIGFNPDFAHEAAVAAGACEQVLMRLISPLRPALFEAGKLRVLLMPIRLNV